MHARFLVGLLLLATCFILSTTAQDQKVNPVTELKKSNSPRHKEILKIVAKGDADVIFIGDSVTQFWEKKGKRVWDENFAPLKAINLGIGGEEIGHVLWRITEGKELDPITPKVAIIMIGTNELYTNSAEEIAGGVKAIVEELRRQKPNIKILLLGIFPRDLRPTDPRREKIDAVNKIMAKFDDDKHVFYKDIGKLFLKEDGTLDKRIMPDELHLNEKGYEIWGNAIKDDIQKLLK